MGSIVVGALDEILIGRALPYTRPGSSSAIDKRPVVAGEIQIGALGLEGDEQGDLRAHGGVDKAIHCYPLAHYAAWHKELPDTPLLQSSGAFGENFSISGMSECDVCIGDRWRAGSCVFEVSQGRQPCWKLNDRFAVADMALRVQNSLWAGWYLRVLQPGRVVRGAEIHLAARPYPAWTVERLLALIRDGECCAQVLQEILALPLPASWRGLFQRRLETGQVELWNQRLYGAGVEPPRLNSGRT
jgi:MOSC domain-containing protein YiiM